VTEDSKNSATTWSTVITTVCSIGSAIGAIGSGSFARYGKWRCIVLNNIIVVAGAAITLVPNTYVITFGRFIYGISNGAFSVFVPLYINETAPVEIKGPLGVMTQLFVTVGIMISFLIGLVIPQSPVTPDYHNSDGVPSMNQTYYEEEYLPWVDKWQVQYYYYFMFGLPIVISLIQVLLLVCLFSYETPKVLKQKGNHAKLNEMMGRIYESSKVPEKIAAIVVEESKGNEDTGPTYSKTLCSPRYKTATFIGIALSCF